MFDASIQGLINRPLNRAGHRLCRLGLQANRVTLAAAITAVATGGALATGHFALGLAFLSLNRLLDGLDGAVARASERTDLGGYLDIVSDYVFYASVPLGFAFADPGRNALPAAALLASFLLTCSTFLAFAALVARQSPTLEPAREKSFFYSRGLIEGAETIAFLVAMTLWPERFALLAWAFSALCVLTALQRTWIAARRLAR